MHVTKMHLAFLDSIGKRKVNNELRERVVIMVQTHAHIQEAQSREREQAAKQAALDKEKRLARLATSLDCDDPPLLIPPLLMDQGVIKEFAFGLGGTEALDC